MKAYRLPDGVPTLFRPDENAARFNRSARRMAMPKMPEGLFVQAVSAFVRQERGWIPRAEIGSLYLRPFLFATKAFLGVRPARDYLFAVIAPPAGSYFKSTDTGLRLWVSRNHARAAQGGADEAKCGGNLTVELPESAPITARLKSVLQSIYTGKAPDIHNWLTRLT